MKYSEIEFYFKMLAAVGAMVAIYFAFLNNRKQFSRELVKEQIKAVKSLIEELESNSMVFTFCRVHDSGFSESDIEGTVFDFAKLKSHPYDNYMIYTNPDLFFSNSFLKCCSDVNIPLSIASNLQKLGNWNVAMISEEALEKYIVAGSDNPITKNKTAFAEIYPSRMVSVSKIRESNKFFTITYHGDFKVFMNDCNQLVTEIKNWLKKYNINDINSKIFKK